MEVVNQAESVINDIERNMSEYKDQLPQEEADKLKDSIANLRQTLANKDESTPEAIREATGELQKSALKLFEVAYKSKVCTVHTYVVMHLYYIQQYLDEQSASLGWSPAYNSHLNKVTYHVNIRIPSSYTLEYNHMSSLIRAQTSRRTH